MHKSKKKNMARKLHNYIVVKDINIFMWPNITNIER